MRRVVADGWHTSRYLINIDWVAVEKEYDVIPKTPNGPRLKSISDDVCQNFCKTYSRNLYSIYNLIVSYSIVYILTSDSYILIFHFLYSYIPFLIFFIYSNSVLVFLYPTFIFLYSSIPPFIFLHSTLIFLYSTC